MNEEKLFKTKFEKHLMSENIITKKELEKAMLILEKEIPTEAERFKRLYLISLSLWTWAVFLDSQFMNLYENSDSWNNLDDIEKEIKEWGK